MNQETITLIEKDVLLSFEGKITFPEVVMHLLQAGIERYYVDLVSHQSIYYSVQGETYNVSFPHTQFPAFGSSFQKDTVVDTIREIQAGKIDYLEFLARVMAAGVVGYQAFLTGKQVHYFGKEGALHIEHFSQ